MGCGLIWQKLRMPLIRHLFVFLAGRGLMAAIFHACTNGKTPLAVSIRVLKCGISGVIMQPIVSVITSIWLCQKTWGRNQCSVLTPGWEEGTLYRWTESVSYTHLTLPTN